jgi:hypothetical protein
MLLSQSAVPIPGGHNSLQMYLPLLELLLPSIGYKRNTAVIFNVVNVVKWYEKVRIGTQTFNEILIGIMIFIARVRFIVVRAPGQPKCGIPYQ